MLTRILTTAALGAGVLLGAIAVVALPGSVWGAGVCGAFVGVLASVRGRDSAPGDAAAKARAGRRAGLRAGARVTGGLLALIGLVLLLGAAPGLLLLVALVVTGVVWSRSRTRSAVAPPADPWRAAQDGLLRGAQVVDPPGRPGTRGGAVPSVVPDPLSMPVPADLTTPQLCVAWQRTYFALLELPVGTSRVAVAGLRERLLDEMERRDPDGFARWLDTDPRAGSNPGPYLAGGR